MLILILGSLLHHHKTFLWLEERNYVARTTHLMIDAGNLLTLKKDNETSKHSNDHEICPLGT